MSKYAPLSRHLSASAGDEWRASFSELESVLGFALPKAARASRAWWINDPDKSHSRAWAAHGWEVGDVDHAAERVVFRKGGAAAELPRREVQPPAMREAAETASARMHATRALGMTAMVTASLAVVAGLGALLARGAMRRRAK